MTGKKASNRAAEELDYGRYFGWFIERDGERIGELEWRDWGPRCIGARGETFTR